MDAYNPEQKAVVDRLVLDMPGVKEGKAFGYPAYKVNGKVFLFVTSKGLALKLPEDRVQALIAAQEAMQPFHPGDGDVVWKQWVSIQRANPEDYQQDVALLEESIEFLVNNAK